MSFLQDTRLLEELLEVLRDFPQGITEHQLLKLLNERGTIRLEADTFMDQVKLFKTHFLLYNALYQLRDRLWQQGAGHLQIQATQIQLQTYQPSRAALDVQDHLRDYYLDLNHLQQQTAEAIEEALSNFWKRFHQDQLFTGGGLKARALKTLGLQEGASHADIKLAYRRLAMQHHPDRGGCAEDLHAINDAMDILRPLLKGTNSKSS